MNGLLQRAEMQGERLELAENAAFVRKEHGDN